MKTRLPSNYGKAIWLIATLLSAVLILAPSAYGDDPQSIDFERDIRSVLTNRCQKCHGAEKQRGGLRLDDKQAALAGGDSGRVIVAGKAADSSLFQRVTSSDEAERMPPEGERLSAAQIAMLRKWLDAGAVWPETNSGVRDVHWSFRPVVGQVSNLSSQSGVFSLSRQTEVIGKRTGQVKNLSYDGGPQNAIDEFVIAKLAEQKLPFSAPADRRTLIRRLYFDLIGLPPTPEEVAAFVADDEPRAYENLVEKLLHSPRHGERWASHWLDVVRFAETDGFEKNLPRPNAWPYRDYVVAAFNDDKPFDRFVMEQLAGDVLGVNAATGFLVGGANDTVRSPDPVLTAQQRADVLHDMVSTTSSAFLGLTVGCARCHNHKFDPIPQADYYAIKAALAGVDHGERELTAGGDPTRPDRLDAARADLRRIDGKLRRFEPLADSNAPPPSADRKAPRPPVHPRVNIERFAPVLAKRLRFTVLETNNAEPCIDELEVYGVDEPSKNIALAIYGTVPHASSVFPNSPFHQIEHINDGYLGNGRSWISAERGKGWVELEFPRAVEINMVVWGRDRNEKYVDRVPLSYTIEVAAGDLPANDASTGKLNWQTIASSRDRRTYVPGKRTTETFVTDSLSPQDKAHVEQLLKDRNQAAATIKELSSGPKVYAGRFAPTPPATQRFHRGDPMQPREPIEPGSLRAIPVKFAFASLLPAPSLDDSLPFVALTIDQQRRLALARWIADPANPLTARVIVNRLWQQHFGEGFVSTSSDFGANGTRPSHPELLDWLAAELMENGWSLRHIHRLIVNSATYRQASVPRPEAVAIDAGSRLLWRYPPRRLDAEPIRDAILAVSGKLDLRMGGSGFSPFEPNDNYVRVYNAKQTFGPEDWRRMIYMTRVRMQQDGTFGAFDCPDGGQIAPKRNRSTTPLQALNLLNSPFIMQQAHFLAERVQRESAEEPAARIRRAFQLVYQREPDAEERTACERLLADHGLPLVCRVLLNSNEFLFVY